MKKVFIGMALAALVATTACAQDQSSLSNDRSKMHHHRGDALAQLNLTDDQKNEMKTINDDFKQQMTDLKKSEDKITVTEWKSKMATIRKDHHAKVDKVLTDEQKASLKKMHKDDKGFRHGNRNRMDRMKKELNLTDEQSTAIQKNFGENMQKMKAVHDDNSLTDDQKKAQFKTLHDQQQESLKTILTPDQWTKFQELKKSHGHGKKPVQS